MFEPIFVTLSFRRGKNDFQDAKRLARRWLADELMLSFVPEPEQRIWRTMTRGKHQLIRDRVRLQNQLESLLEEARIKLSGVISDLLGVCGRRILEALSQGETDPAKLAELGDDRLQCSKQELADALDGSPEPTHRELLKLYRERLALLDQQIGQLDQMTATALKQHEDAVRRVAQIPGLGVDSAQQLIAEVGVDAASFPSAGEFSSWIGVGPGSHVSASRTRAHAPLKGIALCGASSTRQRTRQSKRRTAISSPYSAGYCQNSDTRGPSGRSLIGLGVWSGRFSTMASPLWNKAPKQILKPKSAGHGD